MIKLCFKEYEYKVNLAACKSFYEQTGVDLQYTLLTYLNACVKSLDLDMVDKMAAFHNVCSFDKAAKLIHCLIKQEDNSISLAEIEDAMFRVSWMPGEVDHELCQPWPLVMVGIATEVNQYFSDNMPKKKAAISDQSE